jgi:autophagy-related protein 18
MKFGNLHGQEVVAKAESGGGLSLYSLEKGGKLATNTTITRRPVSVSFSNNILYSLSADYLVKLSSTLEIETQHQLLHSQSLLYASTNNVVTANTTTIYLHDLDTLEVIKEIASDGNRLVLSLSDRFLVYSTLDPNGVDSTLTYMAKKLLSTAISTASSTPTIDEVVMNGIVILDVKTDMNLAEFRAHNNCISALAINPTQTLIVSSSMKGYSFLVWEIPGPRFYDGSNQKMMSKPECIYKLGIE